MPADKEILVNRQAFHEYHILDKYEAGAALVGTEVKSIMAGRIQLKDSYVSVKDGEVWLINAHISPYSHGNRQNHEPLRSRKLLLHRREIEELWERTTQDSLTLVPLAIYFQDGRAKVEIALARGRKLYDKRHAIAARDAKREADRSIRAAQRGD